MQTVLITGASGEVGHGLIEHFSRRGDVKILALDLRKSADLPESKNLEFIEGDILDTKLLNVIDQAHDIETVFHLAALLSTSGEKDPARAHRVNADGSFGLLSMAASHSQRRGRAVKFIFPSTIAVYGIPSPAQKQSAGKIKEDQFLNPITMYGNNKLYVENLGRYFSNYYRFLDENSGLVKLDFRAVRFPGLVSAHTVPTGGTSDYGAEMLHHAAEGKPYDCFVGPEACLPFMTMPDAIKSLIMLTEAKRERLTQPVYNVSSFSISAEEIRQEVLKYFPRALINYKLHVKRSAIVESWPVDIDDSPARRDFGWAPEYDKNRAFAEYLIPAVKERYTARRGHRSGDNLACANA